jgi:hypothetical protein
LFLSSFPYFFLCILFHSSCTFSFLFLLFPSLHFLSLRLYNEKFRRHKNFPFLQLLDKGPFSQCLDSCSQGNTNSMELIQNAISGHNRRQATLIHWDKHGI